MCRKASSHMPVLRLVLTTACQGVIAVKIASCHSPLLTMTFPRKESQVPNLIPIHHCSPQDWHGGISGHLSGATSFLIFPQLLIIFLRTCNQQLLPLHSPNAPLTLVSWACFDPLCSPSTLFYMIIVLALCSFSPSVPFAQASQCLVVWTHVVPYDAPYFKWKFH